jgi:protein-tyrosine phosphatase
MVLVYGAWKPNMPKNILFLCTGNYYRSRFAEILFNALVTRQGLNWQAFSRGLALENGINNRGPISRDAVKALEVRGIPLPGVCRSPRQVDLHDLDEADVIIALKEAEHRPYMQQKFADWADRVQYWHVHDMVPSWQYDPLREIEREVQGLLAYLSHG